MRALHPMTDINPAYSLELRKHAAVSGEQIVWEIANAVVRR
jgi:hypothetical protein